MAELSEVDTPRGDQHRAPHLLSGRDGASSDYDQPRAFTHAVPDPAQRRDIARAVADGIPAEQLAEKFGISESTVHAYRREWAGTQRRTAALTADERQQILDGVNRGARGRYVRTHGRNVVDQVLLEAGIEPAT